LHGPNGNRYSLSFHNHGFTTRFPSVPSPMSNCQNSGNCCEIISERNSADISEMKTIPLSEFSRKCSTLLKLVNKTHESIQVTQFGRPLAEITPPGPSAAERAARRARDVEILNRFADELNAQALSELEDQVFIVLDGPNKNATGRKKKKGRKRKIDRSGATLKP
jgi:prevent-host-death family protein